MRLIDADELRKLFYGYYACINKNAVKENYRGDTLMDYEVVDMIEDCINNTPTIEAEPAKHGHWIICNGLTSNNMYLDENEYYKCSECGKTKGHKSNYCPNCGAKMERRKE